VLFSSFDCLSRWEINWVKDASISSGGLWNEHQSFVLDAHVQVKRQIEFSGVALDYISLLGNGKCPWCECYRWNKSTFFKLFFSFLYWLQNNDRFAMHRPKTEFLLCNRLFQPTRKIRSFYLPRRYACKTLQLRNIKKFNWGENLMGLRGYVNCKFTFCIINTFTNCNIVI